MQNLACCSTLSKGVHQEEKGEDQAVQVEHLALLHLKVRNLQKKHLSSKDANDRRYAKYAEYAVYAKYGYQCDIQ